MIIQLNAIHFLTMSRLLYFTALLLSFLFKNEAAKILGVFPTPSVSHQVVFRVLTQELARRGHEVVVITPDPAFPKGQGPKNLKEIDVHDISYAVHKKMMASVHSGNGDNKDLMDKSFLILLELFEKQTQVEEVQDIILKQNDTFDLILAEAWMRYPLGFSHVIKAPVIQVSSFGPANDNMDVMGAPTNPIVYPYALNKRLHNLSFYEKLTELYNYYSLLDLYYSQEEMENVMVRRIFGADAPPLSELQKNVDMLFLNVHPVWDSNRPVPPSVIYMGGIHQNPKKDLHWYDLQKYLDDSKNGVIYISFGSNVDPSKLPPTKVQAIIKAVSQLPYDVLWKWNTDELPGKTENIKISKWLPQSDLLRHPNIKLFITQGGLQSTDEAITAGVPLIGIPIMGDQWYNVENYVHHKIGKQVNIEDLDEYALTEAITTIIGDKSYCDNIARLRTLMQDQPMPPLQRAVWWTEHVLRHGGARHLRAPAANMPWTQYYEIELVLTVLGALLSVIMLSLLILIFIFRYIKSYLLSDAKVKES